ncbi:MAG: trypsin-like peptidase domain-containing protein [Candidatus Dormiibacterota bacterium]
MGFAKDFDEAAAAARGAFSGVVGVGNRWPSGSGIVFAEGLVVTSAHNVHTETPQLHFADGSQREGTSVTSDQAGDLAVIRVSTEGAEPIKWAEGGCHVGSPVFAAANPGGRGLRLSFGVVAAMSRDFRGPAGHPIIGGFEHTAPLPHGSSGGPVLTLDGELLGINTKRLGEGLYVAIHAFPSLRSRLEALGRGEAVVRPYLGVGLLPGEVARRLRSAVGLPERNGVLVRHLDEEGPAAQAGVIKGDLLTKVNGTELSRVSDLHRALASSKPGEAIELELVRGAEDKQITATLGTPPERTEGHRHGGEEMHGRRPHRGR